MEMMSNRIRVRLEACLNTRFNQSLKRVLSLTLLAALVLSLLTGCGNGKKGEVAEQIYVATVSTEREENAGIFVEPIEGLDGSFMLGADISSLLSEEESGVKYYDADGNEKHVTLDSTDQYLTGQVEPPKDVTVLGGKTGTTSAAGNCLALISQNAYGQLYISIVVGALNKETLYAEMNTMLTQINE